MLRVSDTPLCSAMNAEVASELEGGGRKLGREGRVVETQALEPRELGEPVNFGRPPGASIDGERCKLRSKVGDGALDVARDQ
jgi:hypothetical protein